MYFYIMYYFIYENNRNRKKQLNSFLLDSDKIIHSQSFATWISSLVVKYNQKVKSMMMTLQLEMEFNEIQESVANVHDANMVQAEMPH